MAHMQKLVYILLNGGMKKLEDLATETGCEVNFENGYKSHLPLLLSLQYGFSIRGATLFANNLDHATSLGPLGFLTRILQMTGLGELERMTSIIANADVHNLDLLHKKRYKPRRELNRLVQTSLVKEEGVKMNIVSTEKGAFELWKNGSPLGALSLDTVDMVISIWREMQEAHLDEDSGPLRGVPEWSGEEPVEKLKEARTSTKEMQVSKTFFKWPEMVIEKAGLSFVDTSVAMRLFLEALEEAREDVWAKYERKISVQAELSFGPPKPPKKGEVADTENAEEEDAMILARLQEHKVGCEEIDAWMSEVFSVLPKAGHGRGPALKKMERLLEDRDTYRLSRFAAKHGVTTPLPMTGIMTQLRADLDALPYDIVGNADDLADYLTKSKHPLTGGNLKPKKKAPAAADASGKQFRPEASHGTPPPDLEAAQRPEAVSLSVCAHSAGPPKPELAPKMKELFKLSQVGGFETLSKFASASAPGGASEVARKMRANLQKRLTFSFGIPAQDAKTAVETLLPATFQVIASTTVAQDDPEETGEPLPDPEQRDGGELKKGARVAVAEQKGELARIARPVQGWLKLEELRPLEEAHSDGKETAFVSQLMRAVKNYDLTELQGASDDLDWGFDFAQLARKRVVEFVLAKSQDYPRGALKKSARSKNEEELKSCLAAADRKAIGFVIEALGLTAVPKKPHQAKAKPKQLTRPPKEVRVLMKKVEHLQNALKAKDEELAAAKSWWPSRSSTAPVPSVPVAPSAPVEPPRAMVAEEANEKAPLTPTGKWC